MQGFVPTDQDLFFTRKDPRDPRVGEMASAVNGPIAAGAMVLGGYPDDEGIALNGGRIGASSAPDAIRRFLYRMTPALSSQADSKILDAGNLAISGPLSERHEAARKSVAEVLRQGAYWIGLGGGHDYGFSDGAGFLDFFLQSDERPLVINIDAHLDVRPTDKGLNSGTPFYRLLNDYEGFDLFAVGIQGHCNSRSHFDWCRQNGGAILTLEEILRSGRPLVESGGRFLPAAAGKKRPCYLSVDIDGFSSAYAMGCSQSWATGLVPNEFFPLFDLILERFDVRVLGIYEVSPPLDADHRTAKLAAQIVHHFVFQSG